MQATENWSAYHATTAMRFLRYAFPLRRLKVLRSVRSRSAAMGPVFPQYGSYVTSVDTDQVVQAPYPNGPDQSLRDRIRRRPWDVE